MSKLPDNVSKLPKKGESVSSLADIKALVPRAKEYTVSVVKDGRKVTGLAVKVTPAGNKVWKLVAKSPNSGRNVTKSKPLPAMSYAKAVEWAVRMYAEIKQGEHDKGSEVAEQAKQEVQNELNTPIVELARKRADAMLAQGKIGQRSRTQDYVDCDHLERIIGRTTFLEFGREVARSIGEAINDDNTKRDKLPKLIKKTYKSLSTKTQSQIPYDPKHLLSEEVRPHEEIKKTGDLLPQEQFGLFWSRLMRADVDPIHKDIIVMCLLTGERIEAVLEARVEHINWPYEYLYMEAKASNGRVSKNPVPITQYLGLLLKRLVGDRKEGWLFPTLRTAKAGRANVTGHMSEPSRELYRQLGSYRTIKRLHNHALRRTLANVCASAIGSQRLADEHVLHHTGFNTGAGPNYLDGKSQEFLEVRKLSYRLAHERINELIISQGSKAGWQVYDLEGSAVGTNGFKQPAPHYMIPEAIVFGHELGFGWTDCGTKASVLLAEVSFGEVDDSNTALTVKVTSPLGYFCNGEPVNAQTVSRSERPMIWNALPTSVDYVTKYLDAEYIEENVKQFHDDIVGYEPKPEPPDYLEQFK